MFGTKSYSNTIIISTLSIAVSIAIWLLFRASNSLEGGMDSYNHYLIAKYSFKHPDLLLHYWGKPVYNAIAAPFTQLGIGGSVALNILCLTGSAFLSYKAAQNFGIKSALLAFVFCLFSPIFLDNTISSLTEPLNALLLSWCIYLISGKKWLGAAIIAGFLPYARSEGFIIAGIIGVYLLFFEKNRKAFFALLLGSLVFNVLGWIIEGKALWIITENPYLKFELSGENVCGSGSLFNYIRWGHVTFGLLVCVLLLIALIKASLHHRKNKVDVPNSLIPTLFLSYFGIHSVIWAMGMMGSCGYIRVMVVIAPLAAILAAMAFDSIAAKIKLKWKNLLLLLLVLNSIYAPIRYYRYKYPLQLSQEQKLYVELNNWLQQSEYKHRTLAYMYPYLSVIADIDPWDRKQHEELWMSSVPLYKKGDLLIWDGHFGPNEAAIPLDYLLSHQDYTLIKHFIPLHSFKTLNNYNFEIYVFEKTRDNES